MIQANNINRKLKQNFLPLLTLALVLIFTFLFRQDLSSYFASAATLYLTDNNASTFNQGTHQNTTYNQGSSQLELNAAGKTAGTGTFTSSVKAAEDTTNFENLSWIPKMPYQKELPNNGLSETAYAEGNANMQGNIFLAHFNEASYNGTPNEVKDSSGNSLSGQAKNGAQTEAAGKFSRAAKFDGQNDYVNFGNANALNPGNKDFTFETWFKASDLNRAQDLIGKNNAFRARLTKENKLWVTLSPEDKLSSNIAGLAYDNGFLYYTDCNYHKIFKRKASNFSFVEEYGSFGTGNNQFNCPGDLKIDGNFLYISDYYNNRVLKLNKSDYSFVAKFGTADGSPGSGDNELNGPAGFTIDDSFLYVCDQWNYRVMKINKNNLTFVAKVGSQGSGNDQFYFPVDITSDSTFIFITDRWNDRVVKRYKNDLTYHSKVGTYGSGNDQFYGPLSITNDGTYLFIGDTSNSRIIKRRVDDLTYVNKVGDYGKGNDQFGSYISSLEIFGSSLYVADAQNLRIFERNKEDLSYLRKISVQDPILDPNNFRRSYSHAVDDEFLYVCDTDNSRIVKRRKDDFSFVAEAGSFGTGDEQFQYPTGITADEAYLYIVDQENNRVVKRRKDDLSFVAKAGTYGTGDNNFRYPWGIATAGDYIFIADWVNNRIIKRDKNTLNFVAKVATPWPSAVAARGNYVYIPDNNNSKIVKRDLNFNFVIEVSGTYGQGDDQLAFMYGLTADDNYLYILDFDSKTRIVKRNLDLTFINKLFGDPANKDEFDFPYAIDNDENYLYVGDTWNDRILKLLKSNYEFVEKFEAGDIHLTSNAVITPNVYHHLAITIDNYNILKIYIDGVLDSSVDLSNKFNNFVTEKNFKAGGLANYFKGSLDETALYNRALSATEIQDHYKRGALRAKYQVRSCNDSNCQGEQFVGPDGTSGTYYSELNNIGTGLPNVDLENAPSN